MVRYRRPPMIRLTPGGEAIDPLEQQMSYPRGRSDGPWVMANFVSTVDGAATVGGGSSAINDEDDKEMFAAMRAVPDFIVVGAETVRRENYHPVTSTSGGGPPVSRRVWKSCRTWWWSVDHSTSIRRPGCSVTPRAG
jgi:hypothetical protein